MSQKCLVESTKTYSSQYFFDKKIQKYPLNLHFFPGGASPRSRKTFLIRPEVRNFERGLDFLFIFMKKEKHMIHFCDYYDDFTYHE